MTAKPTPIPDTEPAPPLETDYDVRIPVQVKPSGPTPQRGWAHHHLTFKVKAKGEAQAVDLVMRQIRNVQLIVPEFTMGEDISSEPFDPMAEPEEPAVP
jgi:hypothetical protein